MRAVSRVADVSINTVSKLLIDAGNACEAFHDRMVRDVKAKRVQADEIWSFNYCKQVNAPKTKKQVMGRGDVDRTRRGQQANHHVARWLSR